MDATQLPDYLAIPPQTIPSFHDRAGTPAVKAISRPANASGYPVPGVQAPTAVSVMTKDYFVSDATWSNVLDHGEFDYIVIGSGCTALAFIGEILKRNSEARILCLERGDFWLPTHFQNLPLPFKMVLGGPSETFPWTLSRKTFETKELGYCHGSCPFFGGRSTFWSAWCPQPSPGLMRKFPESMINTTKSPGFWDTAKGLLRVTSAAEIGDPTYRGLQTVIDTVLKRDLNKIPSADSTEPAPLAVGRESSRSTLHFNKFSVPGPLLGLCEKQRKLAMAGTGSPLELMVNCTVTNMQKGDDDYVRILETNQGVLSWMDEKTKIILCAGTIPNATLLLNSFEECRRTVGKRLTGHFLTHIAARCPLTDIGWTATDTLEIAATYLAGRHPTTNKQYHVQITALHSPNPKLDAEDAARECPDYAAAATYEQLKGSENYVVFVCATLGEFTEDNKENFIKLNNNKDPSSNVTLQYTLAKEDHKLWDLMDQATYETIETMSSGKVSNIEYWDTTSQGWIKKRPAVSTIRIPGIVHECSTAYVGPENEGGSLDDLYRPHGVKNVYVTGGAIYPTAGSWNPTLTMCGFAQDLARKLEPKKH
ncbi:hypothetical protein Egran_04466 [Elaphomyces granulatus]|uniref:Glucose-methanol-choline oxidoreductase C-terminal domain-containing protein n=1 Tax=Elaphomyces granulatus TaxID=519963 RepID=A0A232LUC3_9EURO|nr:hypothetical protein Egran_04466 [Elaphomyces granulatus]